MRQKHRCSVPGGTLRKPKELEKAGKRKMRDEDDEEEEENRKRNRKGDNEEREWRIRIEKKLDEVENVGKFTMVNLGSLLQAVEGLKQEVASLGKWIKEDPEMRDQNTDREESEVRERCRRCSGRDGDGGVVIGRPLF